MKSGRRGMTLLEILVAVTISSLIAVGAFTGLRVAITAMSVTNEALLENRRVLGAQRVLVAQFAGFIPAKVDCGVGGGVPPGKALFFQGEPDSIRMVSSYSLDGAARGYPRVLDYRVIPGADGQGVRLVVTEYPWLPGVGVNQPPSPCLIDRRDPFLGEPVARFLPPETPARAFVLADRLAYCRFVYQEPMQYPLPPRWVPRWIRSRPPMAVHLDLAPLDATAKVLPLLPVTLPLRPNRDPFPKYED